MKVAIIGAGPAGLASLRHCLEEGFDCIAFEQTGNIGGIWYYTDNTDVDDDGAIVHTPMYQGLSTNLPKELMEFEDFPYKPSDNYYIQQPEVLQYIQAFAKHFHLLPHIKFFHQVMKVDPLPDQKWRVQVIDIKTKYISEDVYDGIIVSCGQSGNPFYPRIPGMDDFRGRSIHSRSYRKPESYVNKKVLVIGAGPSGLDISKFVNSVAEKVYLSVDEQKDTNAPAEVILKPKANRIKSHSVVFEDGTEEEIDDIIYCTGYRPSYPFLSKECNISVEDGCVKPLYKHIINIEHPTMAIINIASVLCPFPLYSLEVRFFFAFLTKKIQVSKEDMYDDLNRNMKEHVEKDLPLKQFHMIGTKQNEFCETLSTIANVKGVPRVFGRMFTHILTYREHRWAFKVLNDEEFEIIAS